MSILRLGVIGALLILGNLPASGTTFWQIGQADNDTRELALGPNRHTGFGDRFGYHDQFYVVGKSADSEHWPYCLAGPADRWGGGSDKINTLPIHFQLAHVSVQSRCRLIIDYAGISPDRPPRLRVSVNGHHHDCQLPPPAGYGSVRPGSALPGDGGGSEFHRRWVDDGGHRHGSRNRPGADQCLGRPAGR